MSKLVLAFASTGNDWNLWCGNPIHHNEQPLPLATKRGEPETIDGSSSSSSSSSSGPWIARRTSCRGHTKTLLLLHRVARSSLSCQYPRPPPSRPRRRWKFLACRLRVIKSRSLLASKTCVVPCKLLLTMRRTHEGKRCIGHERNPTTN